MATNKTATSKKSQPKPTQTKPNAKPTTKKEPVKKAAQKAKEKNQLEKEVRKSGRTGSFKKKTESSLKWYIETIKKANNELASAKGLAQTVTSRQKLYIGGMYQYTYDAKWKEILPYWDAFPLVIVINTYSDGFLGLNLHYLPNIMRAKLLDKLMEFSTTIKTGGHGMRTYMRLSYELLKGLSEVPFFKHCVKRYLYTQIKSKVMRINADYWEEVAFLPTQQFQKASHTTVWKDAKK